MSSVIDKVKQGVKVAKDVITGRTNIHHSTGVIGHHIRPHNFPKDPNPDPPPKRQDFNDLPKIGGRPGQDIPRFTNLIGSSMGEATSEIPNRPTR